MTCPGKIARLPRALRDHLNRRLQEGDPGPRLLAWLNGRDDVQRILQAEFDGRPINAQNLSDWRRGGYAEWCRYHETAEVAARLDEESRDFDPMGGSAQLTENVATATALLLGRQVRAVEAMPEGPEKLRATLETVRALVRLRRSERDLEGARRAEDLHERELVQRDWEQASVAATACLRGQETLRQHAAEVRGHFETVRQVQADNRELPPSVVEYFAAETEFERLHGRAIEQLNRYTFLRSRGLTPGPDWMGPYEELLGPPWRRLKHGLDAHHAAHPGHPDSPRTASTPPAGVAPVNPVPAQAPVAPAASDGPAAPTAPEGPIELPPAEPAAVPAAPVEPVAPVAPAAPAEPVEPTVPTVPAEPVVNPSVPPAPGLPPVAAVEPAAEDPVPPEPAPTEPVAPPETEPTRLETYYDPDAGYWITK
ncbi:MAG: hypothetical protein NTV51_15315 [Verrucomicrobia bacterium]|nr:hypothetical protein [Verrucomicrobiota bacterium]